MVNQAIRRDHLKNYSERSLSSRYGRKSLYSKSDEPSLFSKSDDFFDNDDFFGKESLFDRKLTSFDGFREKRVETGRSEFRRTGIRFEEYSSSAASTSFQKVETRGEAYRKVYEKDGFERNFDRSIRSSFDERAHRKQIESSDRMRDFEERIGGLSLKDEESGLPERRHNSRVEHEAYQNYEARKVYRKY